MFYPMPFEARFFWGKYLDNWRSTCQRCFIIRSRLISSDDDLPTSGPTSSWSSERREGLRNSKQILLLARPKHILAKAILARKLWHDLAWSCIFTIAKFKFSTMISDWWSNLILDSVYHNCWPKIWILNILCQEIHHTIFKDVNDEIYAPS